MKIAVISIGSFDTQYSDYHLMKDIIIELLQRGHLVSLIQKQYGNTPIYPVEFQPFLDSEDLIVHNIPFARKKKANLKARYLADLAYYYKACNVLKKIKIDKIYLQSNNSAFLPVFFAKNILKKPLVYNEQDIFPENAVFAGELCERSVIYKIAHEMQNYAYNNATLISTISEDMRNTISFRYSIPKDEITVIHNWGHESKKRSEQQNSESNTFLLKYPKKNKEFRVIYAGNLGKMQNVELILLTAKLMKNEENITFYIVGNGTNEAELKKFAGQHDLTNVVFVDMQPPDTVGDLYSSADVNVIPLQPNLIYAALPSKTADCFIAGKPIVACLDKDSEFAKLLKRYKIGDASPSDPIELQNYLLDIQKTGWCGDTKGLLQDYFDKAQNVIAFCNMVENVQKI
ncbi:MAG: hypothetical protein PWQ08_1156 [Clostridiales bacterium]|nr:hypothetical protein [Clostridiales bacterium]